MASIVTSDDDGRTPVLLVTDIGADLDDTLAFLTIAGSPALRLVGVVTSVGDGASRAAASCAAGCAARDADGEVPVLPSVDAHRPRASSRAPGTPAPPTRHLGAVADTPRAIVATRARTARGSRSSASPRSRRIAAALREPGGRDALRGIGRLYLQGQ